MQKKQFWLAAFACSFILLVCTFIFWPILGHDYGLIVPGLIDLKVAWAQFGVFNPAFSPLKCLGTPLWANPVSFNLSLLHILTIVSNDLIAIVLFIIIVAVTSFLGAYQLSRRMSVSHQYSLYLACGWTLQGWMISRTAVGHLTYITFGWFPLIIFLLMKQKTLIRDLFSSLAAAFLLSQYIYLAAPYTPFFLLVSGLILIPIHIQWKTGRHFFNLPFFGKCLLTSVVFLELIYHKITAVKDLMTAYPRHMSLSNVGIFSLPYSVLNLFSFFPHDYKTMVEWWYGNWESVQFMFPLMLAAVIFVLWKKKDEAKLVRLFASIFYILFISFIFCSGILGPIFQELPFINSMHVNPRWNIITALPVFFIVLSLMTNAELLHPRMFQVLFVLVFLAPLIHLNPTNFGISYSYRGGYDEATNRLGYCYEPFLGYSLEYFPVKYQRNDIDFFHDSLIDPRCYLPSRHCVPGSPIKDKDMLLLQSYKLE